MKSLETFEASMQTKVENLIKLYQHYSQSMVKETNYIYDQSVKSYQLNVNNIN